MKRPAELFALRAFLLRELFGVNYLPIASEIKCSTVFTLDPGNAPPLFKARTADTHLCLPGDNSSTANYITSYSFWVAPGQHLMP
ncbi:hypothetical protein BHE74_00005153 [Ensete ventricosum]|nr:hypothetical protein GW17_00023752 [Ensete ventricosum]RWW86092.1 hypothetical protein BHE74_00005153 [Ensete ventricosum]